MKIILGADHGGFEIKEQIKGWLIEKKYEIVDVGAVELNAEDDYVDYAIAAVEGCEDSGDRGILFCRNGMGMSITANRAMHVRCGLAFDEEAVLKGRNDDDINFLSIPCDYKSFEEIKKLIEIFLETKFSKIEKYQRRVDKLNSLGEESGDCCGGSCCGGAC